MRSEIRDRLRWAAGMAGLALLLVAVAFATTPEVANADHQGPTRPVIGAELNLYQYRHRETQITACDGSQTFSNPIMRIEPDVLIDNSGEWAGSGEPSEHWTLELQVFAPFDINGRTKTKLLWAEKWHHQNVKPHAKLRNVNPHGAVPFPGSDLSGVRWEAQQASIWEMDRFVHGGQWKIIVSVIGDESRNRFDLTCRFRWAPAS